jgi:hypothetical protein
MHLTTEKAEEKRVGFWKPVFMEIQLVVGQYVFATVEGQDCELHPLMGYIHPESRIREGYLKLSHGPGQAPFARVMLGALVAFDRVDDQQRLGAKLLLGRINSLVESWGKVDHRPSFFWFENRRWPLEEGVKSLLPPRRGYQRTRTGSAARESGNVSTRHGYLEL